LNKTLYFCGPGDPLKAFPIADAQMATSPSSTSPEPYGYPGCVPSISANGTSNAIVWALQPPGALAAYNAGNLANELYTSNQNAQRDALGNEVKFSVPTVANGKVYAGTQSEVVVYGLLPQADAEISAANSASAIPNSLAPGALATIYGSGLANGTDNAASSPLPRSLAGASVKVNGITAPILFASPKQINFQIPFETSPGAAAIGVSVNGAAAGAITVPVFPVAPGIFMQSSGDAAVVNQDGSINSTSLPASVGSVVSAYVTGLGSLGPALSTGTAAQQSPLSTVSGVTAIIGGVPAVVQYAGGAPGFAGLYQVNIQIPAVASGQNDLWLFIQGASSNTAPVHVQ
jgi:uncharacterized protein (TIGR03437 family)